MQQWSLKTWLDRQKKLAEKSDMALKIEIFAPLKKDSIVMDIHEIHLDFMLGTSQGLALGDWTFVVPIDRPNDYFGVRCVKGNAE